jgi:hypothetical protein
MLVCNKHVFSVLCIVIALGTRETVLEGKCKVLAIVKSADNSLMSQEFEVILMTVYSDRILLISIHMNITSLFWNVTLDVTEVIIHHPRYTYHRWCALHEVDLSSIRIMTYFSKVSPNIITSIPRSSYRTRCDTNCRYVILSLICFARVHFSSQSHVLFEAMISTDKTNNIADKSYIWCNPRKFFHNYWYPSIWI